MSDPNDLGYIAIPITLTDVVDAFAIVQLINIAMLTKTVDDRIRPVAIMTKQTYDHQEGCYVDSEPSILFRSESGQSRLRRFGHQKHMTILKEFCMTGSRLKVKVVHGNPHAGSNDPYYHSRFLRQYKRELKKAWSGDEIQDDSLTTAVTVSKLLGCALQRQEEENFWSAVQARSDYLRTGMGGCLSVPTFVQDAAVFQVVTYHNAEICSRVAREMRRRHGIPPWYSVRVSNQGCNANQILVSIYPVSHPGEQICCWKECVGHIIATGRINGRFSRDRLAGESPTWQLFPVMHFSSSQSLLESFSTNGEPLVFCHTLDPYVHTEFPNSAPCHRITDHQ